MLRQHGSVQPDSRASDVDADYRLAMGPRWLHNLVNGSYSASLGRRIRRQLAPYGAVALRRGAIGTLSGLLLMASVFLPFPKDGHVYARELTSDAVQAAADDSQSWQPSPALSNSVSSLFKLNPPNPNNQAGTPDQSQSTDNAQPAQPADPGSNQPATQPATPARVAPSSRGGTRPTPDISTHAKFIAAVAEAAQDSQTDSGVPASVSVAQAILESDWGQSLLSKKAQNYFGIKASKGPGPAGVISMSTWEVIGGANVTVNDGFKAYHNLYESVMDHGRFLADNSRYAAAFKVPNDPQQFARRIHAAGYATDPAYSTKLINLMNKFNLYQYDLPQPGR